MTRIVGEMRKLGIKISRQTVRRILNEDGISPSPDRTSDSWSNFLDRHKNTLWGCDFFSVKAVTPKGFRELYVMAFLNFETKERRIKPHIIIHDRDAKFSKQFKETVEKAKLKTNPLPKCSPNLNGRCERFIGTIKIECLSRFIIFGKRHLDHLLQEYTTYYNTSRSHTSRCNLPPNGRVPEIVESIKLDQIEVVEFVGGLVKSFERKAA